jgi:hypothetical protein
MAKQPWHVRQNFMLLKDDWPYVDFSKPLGVIFRDGSKQHFRHLDIEGPVWKEVASYGNYHKVTKVYNL